MEAGPPLSTLVRTLLSVGFRISSTQHKPSYIAISAVRADEFGVENRYLFAFVAEDRAVSGDDVTSLEKAAHYERSSLVIVGSVSTSDGHRADNLSVEEFLGRLGGPIPALLPLESEYPERLRVLGLNSLPSGLSGKADTIFEQYVHAGLQFILQDRVVRYGQDRLFEALPDAVG